MSSSGIQEDQINQPVYYHRQYENDFKGSIPQKVSTETKIEKSLFQQTQRVTIIALPFISFYKPFGSVISPTMNFIRTFTCLVQTQDAFSRGEVKEIGIALFQTAMAVAAIAGAIFGNVYGMALTSGHDVLISLYELVQHLEQKEYEKALESFLQLVNNSLYLTMLLHGSLEITILSLAAQILLEVYKSQALFRKGKNGDDALDLLEGFAHLGVAGIRVYQIVPRIETLQFKYKLNKILASLPETNSVGKLKDRWEFPSDHLPVGAKVNGAHIGSWNVLNKNYMDWIVEKDSQGLNGSLITKLDKPSQVMKGLTEREVVIIHQIVTMIDRSDQPFHALALQECRPIFIQGLMHMLPDQIEVICSDPDFINNDQNILLFNKNIFTYFKSESFPSVTNVFKDQPNRALMDIVLQNKVSGQKFQLINAHLPGDPNLPGRYQFADYVLTHQRTDTVTIGLGDMNFNHVEMQEAFDSSAKKLGFENPFKNPINYYTNIGVEEGKKAKIIDHLWIGSAHSQVDTRVDLPDEVLPGLQRTVNLLLPDHKLESLYHGVQIDYNRCVNLRWEYYSERLRKWNATHYDSKFGKFANPDAGNLKDADTGAGKKSNFESRCVAFSDSGTAYIPKQLLKLFGYT